MAFQKQRSSPNFSIAFAVFLLSSACNGENLKIGIDDKTDEWKNATSVYDFIVNDYFGNPVYLDDFRNYVLMIFTVEPDLKNYEPEIYELNEIYETYYERGMRFIAFLSDTKVNETQNMSNEISEDDINKYNIKYEILEQTKTFGDDAHPLWKYLKHLFSDEFQEFKTPFTKFLTTRNGIPVQRLNGFVSVRAFSIYINPLIT